MPLSLAENFTNDTNSCTVLLGTWERYNGYLRMTQWVTAEPQAVVVFYPGDNDYKYNDHTVDPPVVSFAQLKIAAQQGSVGGVGCWLLSGTEISGHPLSLSPADTAVVAAFDRATGMEARSTIHRQVGRIGVELFLRET